MAKDGKKPAANSKKPNPGVLGKGLAGKAGQALSSRERKLQEQMKKLGI